MTPETPENPVNSKPDIGEARINDANLGSLYEIKKGAIREKVQQNLQSLAEKIDNKDMIESEMVLRITSHEKTKKDLRELYFPEDKDKRVDQSTIDAGLMKLFEDKFHIVLDPGDLRDLRDNLPIIDEIRDGKCFAYGKQGESHAVQFDDFVIEEKKNKEGKNEGYTFVYKVYVDVPNGSEKLKQMVRQSDLSFGSTQVGGHKFDVVVKGDPAPDYQPDKDKGNLPIVKEVNKDSAEYEQGKGQDKQDYKGVCLTDKNGRKTILIRQDLPDGEKQAVIKHEISHLCGMVSEGTVLDEKTHQERPITLEDAPKDQKALLTATEANGVDDTKGKRKEYLHAQDLTETRVLENFDMNEQKRGIQETLREKKIVMNNATINIIVNGIKKYVGERLPVIAQEKDVGVESFVMETDAAKACKEQMKTEIKEKFNPLFDVVSVFDQYPQIKASYQTNAQEFNFDTCRGLSQTLSDLVSSDQSVYMFLKNTDYRISIENIKKEMQKSLDGKKDAITQFEAHTPSTVNDVEGKTFDTFDQKLQDYLTAIASPELLAVVQPQQINGTAGAQEKVKSDLIANIKNKITDTSIPQNKKDYIAEKYFEYLVKTGKIIIPSSVPSDADAYRTKYENGVLTVEYGKKEDWEKEGKAPETPGTKPEGILGQFQGLFGEAKQAFEKAIQDKKSIFAAIGAAIGVFFTGLLKFLGDKFGLKLTPDESAEQDVAASKAAFEKVSDGLASPSIDWFKQQSVVVKGDKTWDDAWKDFMGDTKVQAYLTEAKKTENAAKYSYSDASHAGILLEEAAAFKASGATDAAVFYKDKHKEGEKSASEKIKDGVKQTWDDMKKEYSDVELDDSVITALDIKEPLETSGQPDQNAYKKKIEALFGECLGGIAGVKNWITKLEVKTLTMEQIQFLKTCKGKDVLCSIQNLDWGKVKTAYAKTLKLGESYTFESCFQALQNITTEQLQIIMSSSNPVWPSPQTK